MLTSESTSKEADANPDGGVTVLSKDASVRDLESNPDGTLLFMTTGDGALLVRGVPKNPYFDEQDPDGIADPDRAVSKLGSEATAREVEVSPDGTLVYVTSFETGTLSIYKFGTGFGAGDALATSNVCLGFGY